jgi:iron complex transport system substrate-binding protein
VTPPPPQKFTDAARRSLALPAEIERVIPAGPSAAVLVYALAPEKLVGIIESWTDKQRVFVPEAYRGLSVLPRLTHPTSEADLALLRGKHADLIVDYGDIGPAYVATAERVQTALFVPYILLDGRMAQIPGALRSLGASLGRKDRGKELADLAAQVLERLRPV